MHKYKVLKPKEAQELIHTSTKNKHVHPSFSYVNFYEIGENELIWENTRENKFALYYDRAKYYADIEFTIKFNGVDPLSNPHIQKYIVTIDNPENITSILKDFYSKINLPHPTSIGDVDLNILDRKIKEYGYEDTYVNLLFHLIVFCGEYVRRVKGGEWKIAVDNRSNWYKKPIYFDGNGESYEFWINVLLARQFIEKRAFNIKHLLKGAMLPNVFKVNPNPGLTDPNELR